MTHLPPSAAGRSGLSRPSLFERAGLALERYRLRARVGLMGSAPYRASEGWLKATERSRRRIARIAMRSARLGFRASPPERSQNRRDLEVPDELDGPIEIAERHGAEEDSSPLPIVFVHSGDSEYLRYALAQARKHNPDSPIYLLGDASNDRYAGIEHRHMTDYFGEADALTPLYRHHNTTGWHFELLNFQRWFVLRDFLVAHQLPRCLYLDSDILLFTNVTEDRKKFALYDFTLTYGTAASIFFLNRVDALSDFCQFVMAIYSGKDRYSYDRMVAQYALRKKNGLRGGACDMTAFEMFSQAHFGRIGEVGQIIDDSVYDPSISITEPGFVMSRGIKRLVMRDGIPFGTHLPTGRQIRFNALHFQGKAKVRMREFCSDPTILAD